MMRFIFGSIVCAGMALINLAAYLDSGHWFSLVATIALFAMAVMQLAMFKTFR